MPNINANIEYQIELTDDELQEISDGGAVATDLPDGPTIELTSGGVEMDGVEVDDDADFDDVKELVEEGQEEAPPSQDNSDDLKQQGSGIIDIDRVEE